MEQLIKQMESLYFKEGKSCREILDLMSIMIDLYSTHRRRLSDEQISMVRSYLSATSYKFISECYESMIEEYISDDIAFGKAEGGVFQRKLLEVQRDGYSKSQSIDIARKVVRSDEEYMSAYRKALETKNAIKLYDKILRAVEQVLNSMAKRTQ